MTDTDYADHIAGLAVRSLLHEAAVTPKPGLVDRRDSGAHSDMDFFTFIDSSAALASYFREVTYTALHFPGEPEEMIALLRPLGLRAERTMLSATGGVNTHKGLIFSLGLVCAAAGYARPRSPALTEDLIFGLCARMAAGTLDELAGGGVSPTHGVAAYRRHGCAGARGEAAEGFPNVRRHGLPALRGALDRGLSRNDAGVWALLHLMAHADDTNIVSRADLATLRRVQEECGRFLRSRGSIGRLLPYAEALNGDFVRRGISPGGCADLLALTYMLFFLLEDRGMHGACHQKGEGDYGACQDRDGRNA